MTDLEYAKKILAEQDCTCVLAGNDRVYIGTDRGIKPLVLWLESSTDCRGFSAADKVIGRATAFLYARLGVTEVYASVMSRGAVEVLDRFGIAHSFGTEVDAILNRKKDGFCPMESAVREITDPELAWQVLSAKYHELNP